MTCSCGNGIVALLWQTMMLLVFFFFPVIAPQGGEKRSLGKGKGKEQSKEK
jgi:hypothetical protein